MMVCLLVQVCTLNPKEQVLMAVHEAERDLSIFNSNTSNQCGRPDDWRWNYNGGRGWVLPSEHAAYSALHQMVPDLSLQV